MRLRDVSLKPNSLVFRVIKKKIILEDTGESLSQALEFMQYLKRLNFIA